MFTFSIPTTALFGAGKLNELHTQINSPMGVVHGKKALIVISNGKSTRINGYLDRLEEELDQAGVQYVIFDKVAANPTKPVVEEGGCFARDNGCDFIVALGGGSVMDAAKAIGLMAANGGDLWDYVMFGSGKSRCFRIPACPLSPSPPRQAPAQKPMALVLSPILKRMKRPAYSALAPTPYSLSWTRS